MTVFEAVRNQFKNLKADSAPFSVEALARLQFHVDRYIDSLITESFLIMNRSRSERILPEFVDVAATNIRSRGRRKLLGLLGMLGGACFSAGFTQLYEIYAAAKPVQPRAALFMAVWFCAAVSLIAIQFSRE